jgi:hypothetical protein
MKLVPVPYKFRKLETKQCLTEEFLSYYFVFSLEIIHANADPDPFHE